MKKIMNLSEGVRESLRRLSSVTWMAEELLRVADYFQPNKWVSVAVRILSSDECVFKLYKSIFQNHFFFKSCEKQL